MILIHPSSLGRIMTDPKSKAAKEAGELSEGAKTYLTSLAKEIVYGYKAEFTSKYTTKGVIVEQQSIDLFNHVYFTDYQKNSARVETDLLSGECDIFDDDVVIDIKSSWSLETFPATTEDAHDSDYEWQLRAYMHLFNVNFAKLAFCMVTTPEELIGREQPGIHIVDHIDPLLRITTVQYERDMNIEEKMLSRCAKAQEFVSQKVEQIKQQHIGV